MSSSEGDEHLVSHVSDLLGLEEPYLYRPDPSDQEEEESPFRIVWQTSRFTSGLTHVLVLAPTSVQALVGPVGIA